MQKLVELLNSLIQKYNMEQADVEQIQAALSELEGNTSEEFEYEDEKEEDQAHISSHVCER